MEPELETVVLILCIFAILILPILITHRIRRNAQHIRTVFVDNPRVLPLYRDASNAMAGNWDGSQMRDAHQPRVPEYAVLRDSLHHSLSTRNSPFFTPHRHPSQTRH
ncbi:hypothetical protein Moror_12516 [Moniliophthora roreri MCA 2997]|uniref:Uncharacterized protein n=1 Tax=Moniliophthora roreri (strain MCA 2997) TaxID=1381753 RepID=V2XPQ4_MONRO|nr:hypothetical protein Moror_12516 [Moniliophthora roreri MCA 2997]